MVAPLPPMPLKLISSLNATDGTYADAGGKSRTDSAATFTEGQHWLLILG